MRLIFWFLVAANAVMLTLRVFVGVPESFQQPKQIEIAVDPRLAMATTIEMIGDVAQDEVASEEAASDEVEDLQEERQKDEAPPARVLSSKPMCKMIGPFGKSSEADNFVLRLGALDVDAAKESLELSAGVGYWIYLEPLDTRANARLRLKELQGRGVDSYIIPKGELRNGISLGVFSRKKLAEVKIKEIAGLGLTPKMQEIDRLYNETWVMLKYGEEQKIGDQTWKTLLEGKKHLKEQQNFCLDVASR